jgi:thioredoxin reductase (NADPH)
MITAEILREFPLFAELPAHELETIAARAADVALAPGDWLVSEGETPSFFGVITGTLDVVKGAGIEQHNITTYDPGDTFGEIPLLLDAPALVSVRALERTRVFRLDAADFRSLILECTKLSAQVATDMMRRVANMQRIALEAPKHTVTIVGHRWDLDCHDVRDFLARNHIPFTWIDPADEPGTHPIPEELRNAKTYPIVILTDGRHLIAPSPRELAEGVGPAGLAAAVYGASEGLRTVIFEREAPGGQAGTSSRIENYLGFPTGLSGDELGKRAHQQATRFGAEIVVARNVERLEPGAPGKPHTIHLDGGASLRAGAVVIATGVTWRKLDVPGLDDFGGRGVYYGAARTEAFGTQGKRIHLIGGGNSAGQAAMFFANYAEHVTILVRRSGLAETMSHYLIAELATKANVTVEPHSEVAAVHGTDHLESLEIEDTRTHERRTVPSDALFIFIGADAETTWLPPEIVRDENGYVCTGRDVLDILDQRHAAHPWPHNRDPYLLETSIPGIFAAGDVRHGSIKRVASGVGEGSMTVAFIHQYLQTTH